MAISTKYLTLTRIGEHPENIGKSAIQAISKLSVAVEEACKYSAYMNSIESALTVDAEDRLKNSKIFRNAVFSLTPVLESFTRLQALDEGTVSKEDFIADMESRGLNLQEYAKQLG